MPLNQQEVVVQVHNHLQVQVREVFLEEKRKPIPSMPSDDESPTIDVAFERPWDDIVAERALLRNRRVA